MSKIYYIKRKVLKKFKSIFSRKYLRPVILETGAWLGKNNHFFDRRLASAILEIFNNSGISKNDVISDFGCGSEALYCRYFSKKGYKVIGIDGNKNVEFDSRGLGYCKDLTLEFDLEIKNKFAICLEVGEHIPKSLQNIFLRNITFNTTKKLVLSWAVVGQGGHGHVNEKDRDEVIEIIEKLNFKYNEIESLLLLKSAGLKHFRRTMFVFDKV
jgi:hypothetical protein